MTTVLLAIDSVINLSLGISLLFFPRAIVSEFGMPEPKEPFYPYLLGAVLFGIGVALGIEMITHPATHLGLGLVGAITINLCAAAVLTIWLLRQSSIIRKRGRVLLWSLNLILVALSAVEIIATN